MTPTTPQATTCTAGAHQGTGSSDTTSPLASRGIRCWYPAYGPHSINQPCPVNQPPTKVLPSSAYSDTATIGGIRIQATAAATAMISSAATEVRPGAAAPCGPVAGLV